MRLVTQNGDFVADVEPVVPPIGRPPNDGGDLVVFWGNRVFVKTIADRFGFTGEIWRETLPLVVEETRNSVSPKE